MEKDGDLLMSNRGRQAWISEETRKLLDYCNLILNDSSGKIDKQIQRSLIKLIEILEEHNEFHKSFLKKQKRAKEIINKIKKLEDGKESTMVDKELERRKREEKIEKKK